MSKTDRILICFGVILMLAVASTRVYLRADEAASRAEAALAEGRHFDALFHAQEASRSWLPFAPFRQRAESVLAQVAKHADDTHNPSLRVIADRARESARIESEWLAAGGARSRVHGRPSWLGAALVAAFVASLLASLRFGKRWPVVAAAGLVCCALGYLLPL